VTLELIFLITVLLVLGNIALLIFLKEYRLLAYGCFANFIIQSVALFSLILFFDEFGSFLDYLRVLMDFSVYLIVLFLVGFAISILWQIIVAKKAWKYPILMMTILSVQLLIWSSLQMITDFTGGPQESVTVTPMTIPQED